MKRLWLSVLMLVCWGFLSHGAEKIAQGTLTSEAVRLDSRTDFGGRLVRGTQRISPVAERENANVRLSVDGTAVTDWSVAKPEWDSTTLADGRYGAILNEGSASSSVELAVLNDDSVAVHGGVLEADTTWKADKVHIVQYWVRIPAGKTLTIENGAVVKFCTLTGLQVDGTLKAVSTVLTHISDDTAGGDTDMASSDARIAYGAYSITGSGTKTMTGCEVRYSATLPVSTTWKSGEVYPIYGTLTVISGVTLTIEKGAIVKFATGARLVCASGGSVSTDGAIFTHIADDTIGGDTNGDGDASSPLSDKYEWSGFTPASTCELRYRSSEWQAQTVASGQTLTFLGNRVNKVLGNITVASGGKLVVQPGAIVKMNANTGITVNSGATLEAIGNRAQPIFFTSYRDDDHGGDTDGDGGKMEAGPGDWRVIYIHGSATMNYCYCYYGGNTSTGQYNDADCGIISISSSGTLNLNNSIISDSVFEGIKSFGHDVYISNTIISYCNRGINTRGGSLHTIVNCIAYKCTVGYMEDGPETRVVNSIAYQCIERGFWPYYNRMKINNCLSYSSYANHKHGLYGGQQGNITNDPLFTNPENGDFTLQAGSPCIDAGDGTVAPETDYWGKPRMDVVKVADKGKANADGICPDIGIYEMPGSNGGPCANLAAVEVSGDAEATAGKRLTVTWSVRNDGNVTAAAPRRDSLFLRGEDTELGGQVVALGEFTATSALEPLAEQTFTAIFQLPALKAGKWSLGVTVNSYRDVYEVKRSDNEIWSEAVTEVSVPAATAGTQKASVSAEGSTVLSLPAKNTAWMILVKLASVGSLTASAARGYVPDGTASTAVELADGRLLLTLSAGEETGYLTLWNDGTANTTAEITLSELKAQLLEATPQAITNNGQTTLKIIGCSLTSAMAVKLVKGSTVYNGQVLSCDGVTLTAQFSLQNAQEGVYALKAGNLTLANAVTVKSSTGGARLEAWLEKPASVRDGRIYTAWLCYKNSGDADMTMPLFEVSCSSSTKISYTVDGEFASRTLRYPKSRIKQPQYH